MTGVVRKIEARSGTLDNGKRWANQTVTIMCDGERTPVKFPEDEDLAALGIAEGTEVDVWTDAFKPSLRFDGHVGGSAGKRLASA